MTHRLLFAALWLPAAALAAEPLTLEGAVRLALERNERAQIATARVDAAEARVAQARSFFFPDVALGATYRRQPEIASPELGVIRPSDTLTGTATLTMSLFDGRSIPLYRAAARDAEATALEASRERRIVAFEAADAYLQTLGAQEVDAAARRRLQLARQTLEEANLRLQAGLVSSNDVTRAQLEFATAEQSVTAAQGQAKLAMLQLAYLIDAPIEALAPVDTAVPQAGVARMPPDALVARAVDAREDLAAASKRVELQEALAQEPLWRWVPSLNLTAQYQKASEAGRFGRPDDWFAQISASWVIFDGLERFADREEQLALLRIARLNREQSRRRVALEVRAALVSLQSAEAAVRQAEVGARVARQNAQETSTLYQQGLARAIEVADANLRLFEAEVALAREQYTRALAWLDLRAALGLDPLGGEPSP